MPEPRIPTQEELNQYDAMLEGVIEKVNAGEDAEPDKDQLRKFMLKTGIASEPPVTDFPELDEPANE